MKHTSIPKRRLIDFVLLIPCYFARAQSHTWIDLGIRAMKTNKCEFDVSCLDIASKLCKIEISFIFILEQSKKHTNIALNLITIVKSIVVSGRTLGQRRQVITSNNNEQKPNSMEFNLFIYHSILESWLKHNEIWVGNKWCYMIYAAMLGHTVSIKIWNIWTGHSEMSCTSARFWR